MGLMAVVPGMPMLPFAALAVVLGVAGLRADQTSQLALTDASPVIAGVSGVVGPPDQLAYTAVPEIEVRMGRPVAAHLMRPGDGFNQRLAKLRKRLLMQFGVVVPEIHVSASLDLSPDEYVVSIQGADIARGSLRLGHVLVLLDERANIDVPGQEVKEAAFGSRALWCFETYSAELRRLGHEPIEIDSVLLTHLAEVLKANLAQLLSYKGFRALVEAQEPAYRKLIEELVPSHLSLSALHSVTKLLLQERVSIRSFPPILEAVAELAPFTRKIETLVEHVRGRLSQQLCGDLADDGVLHVVRLGAKWESLFHSALKRDGRGDVVEFDIDPQAIEAFGSDLSRQLRGHIEAGMTVSIVCGGIARPYVRMIVERLFPAVSVLSHTEIARGIAIKHVGSVS
jgi:flagellar biosynthesis protein FlhA